MTATATAASQRVVPTVAQPVRVSWADWIEQILVHETPLIEAGAGVLVSLGIGAIPIVGPTAAKLIAPTLVKQVVDQGLALLEGMLAQQSPLAIDKPSWLQSFAVTTLNQIAPNFAKTVGAQLDPMIADAIAKVTPAPKLDVPAPDPGVPTTSRGR